MFSLSNKKVWLVRILPLMSFFAFASLVYLSLGFHALLVPDEGRYVGVANEMLHAGSWVVPRINGVPFLDKPILYYWFEILGMKLFGANLFGARVLPATIGLFGVFMTFVAGKRLYNRRVGYLSAILLGACPLYFLSMGYADMDLEIAVWVNAAFLCFLVSFFARHESATDAKRWMQGAYLFAALAVLTKGLIGIVFPMMTIGLWMILRNRWDAMRRLHIAWGVLILLVINLPWYGLMQHALPEFFTYFFYYQQVLRFLASGYNNVQPFWFYLPVFILGALPWSLYLPDLLKQVWGHRRHKSTAQHAESLYLLSLWVLVIFLFFSIPHSKIVGYLLPIFPCASLLFAYYFNSYFVVPRRSILLYIPSVLLSLLFIAPVCFWPQVLHHAAVMHAFPWLRYALFLLFVVAAVSLIFTYRRRHLITLTLLGVTLSGLLFSAFLVVNDLQPNSNYPLYTLIKSQVKQADKIVYYRNNFNDLVFYTHKMPYLVGDWSKPKKRFEDTFQWRMRYGAMIDPASRKYLLSEAQFRRLWSTTPRIIVITRAYQESRIKQLSGARKLGAMNHLVVYQKGLKIKDTPH